MKNPNLATELAFGLGVALGAVAMHELDRRFSRSRRRPLEAIEIIEVDEATG